MKFLVLSKALGPILGTIIPYFFKEQEFKPKRLAAVVLCGLFAWGLYSTLGSDGAEFVVELTEQLVESTQE